MEIPTIKELRDLGGKPRVHGNGFIQLDLDERRRLHVWGDPRIPRQKVNTPIHDHVFGFRSWVLRGRIINIQYHLTWKDGGYRLWEARAAKGEDTKLVRMERRGLCEMLPWTTRAIPAGESYAIRPFVFHEAIATELTVTIIDKDAPTLVQNSSGNRPRVAILEGQEPDNNFDRGSFNTATLWRIIENALEQ